VLGIVPSGLIVSDDVRPLSGRPDVLVAEVLEMNWAVTGA
jgi:hypothetical protein